MFASRRSRSGTGRTTSGAARPGTGRAEILLAWRIWVSCGNGCGSSARNGTGVSSTTPSRCSWRWSGRSASWRSSFSGCPRAAGAARRGAEAEPLRTRAGEEMADVLLYLVLLADVLDIDLAEAARLKLAAAQVRYPPAGRGRSAGGGQW